MNSNFKHTFVIPFKSGEYHDLNNGLLNANIKEPECCVPTATPEMMHEVPILAMIAACMCKDGTAMIRDKGPVQGNRLSFFSTASLSLIKRPTLTRKPTNNGRRSRTTTITVIDVEFSNQFPTGPTVQRSASCKGQVNSGDVAKFSVPSAEGLSKILPCHCSSCVIVLVSYTPMRTRTRNSLAR